MLLSSSQIIPILSLPNCPSICLATACSFGILQCEHTGLRQIPPNPPSIITKVILKYQLFDNKILTYMNLSRYGPDDIILQELTISHCQLVSIEPESFSHLSSLKYLDLSYNRLGLIIPNTFKSLSLTRLNLDGNHRIQLTDESFRGLLVNSLSMENCSLTELNFENIKQISGYLTELKLSNNNLKTFNNYFDLIFRRLNSIQIYNNPFNCSCQLRWLPAFLQQSKLSLKSNSARIQCNYPPNLRGAPIIKLNRESFHCPVPKIKRIELRITSSTTAELTCISDSNSNSRVKWRYKFVKSKIYYKYSDTINDKHDSSISVNKQFDSDLYSCLIVNDNGNATVDIKIKWPSTKFPFEQNRNDLGQNRSFPHHNSTKGTITNTPFSTNYIYNDNKAADESNIVEDNEGQLTSKNNNNGDSSSSSSSSSSQSYLWLKQYTFMEMILAICGTFMSTIISFLLLYALLSYRRKHTQTKHALKGYEVGLYSDSQTYDIPQLSPYHEANNNARLLDFKTQQEIQTGSNWSSSGSPR